MKITEIQDGNIQQGLVLLSELGGFHKLISLYYKYEQKSFTTVSEALDYLDFSGFLDRYINYTDCRVVVDDQSGTKHIINKHFFIEENALLTKEMATNVLKKVAEYKSKLVSITANFKKQTPENIDPNIALEFANSLQKYIGGLEAPYSILTRSESQFVVDRNVFNIQQKLGLNRPLHYQDYFKAIKELGDLDNVNNRENYIVIVPQCQQLFDLGEKVVIYNLENRPSLEQLHSHLVDIAERYIVAVEEQEPYWMSDFIDKMLSEFEIESEQEVKESISILGQGLLTFEQALQAMKAGSAVYRESKPTTVYIAEKAHLSDNSFKLYSKDIEFDNDFEPVIAIVASSLVATDWKTVSREKIQKPKK